MWESRERSTKIEFYDQEGLAGKILLPQTRDYDGVIQANRRLIQHSEEAFRYVRLLPHIFTFPFHADKLAYLDGLTDLIDAVHIRTDKTPDRKKRVVAPTRAPWKADREGEWLHYLAADYGPETPVFSAYVPDQERFNRGVWFLCLPFAYALLKPVAAAIKSTRIVTGYHIGQDVVAKLRHLPQEYDQEWYEEQKARLREIDATIPKLKF